MENTKVCDPFAILVWTRKKKQKKNHGGQPPRTSERQPSTQTYNLNNYPTTKWAQTAPTDEPTDCQKDLTGGVNPLDGPTGETQLGGSAGQLSAARTGNAILSPVSESDITGSPLQQISRAGRWRHVLRWVTRRACGGCGSLTNRHVVYIWKLTILLDRIPSISRRGRPVFSYTEGSAMFLSTTRQGTHRKSKPHPDGYAGRSIALGEPVCRIMCLTGKTRTVPAAEV